MTYLLTILVALCVTSLIHNALEIWGMRQKVRWLRISMQGRRHGKWPFDIDSKLKSASLHSAIFIVTTGVMFLILESLGISDRALIGIGISVLIVSYIHTTWKIDTYHTEIGSLISKAKKAHKRL